MLNKCRFICTWMYFDSYIQAIHMKQEHFRNLFWFIWIYFDPCVHAYTWSHIWMDIQCARCIHMYIWTPDVFIRTYDYTYIWHTVYPFICVTYTIYTVYPFICVTCLWHHCCQMFLVGKHQLTSNKSIWRPCTTIDSKLIPNGPPPMCATNGPPPMCATNDNTELFSKHLVVWLYCLSHIWMHTKCARSTHVSMNQNRFIWMHIQFARCTHVHMHQNRFIWMDIQCARSMHVYMPGENIWWL